MESGISSGIELGAGPGTPDRALNWLFALDPSSGAAFGTGQATLEWAHPVPAWAWVLAALGAAGLAALAYARLRASGRVRVFSALCRALAVLLIVVLLAGPKLVARETGTEPDWVAVLVDRSRSMTIADGATTRDAQANAAAGTLAAAIAAERPDTRTAWFAFGRDAFVLSETNAASAGTRPAQPDAETVKTEPARTNPAPPDLGPAEGEGTRLAHALNVAGERMGARRLAGVVVISDGRSSDGPADARLDALTATGVPVFTIPVGSPEAAPDLAVTLVEGPTSAFKDDEIPVRARIELTGGKPPTGATVQLVDRLTDRVLTEQPLTADDFEPAAGGSTGAGMHADVALRATPEDDGERDWVVRVRTPTPDLLSSNDERVYRVRVVDRPLRVLHIDGSPRWEQRYLKNLLLREPTIDVTSVLVASGRRFIQEGTPIDRLPVSPGEWEAYDVVILGDLRAELFGPEQLAQLAEHVAQSGAGVLWIAGPGRTSASWAESPAAGLLPVRHGSGEGASETWTSPVVLAPTPEADRLGVLRLDDAGDGWPDALSSASAGWSSLRWAERLGRDRLQPAAITLATASPVVRSGSGVGVDTSSAAPVLVTMRYGAGRVLYCATDETWRWRYGRGEVLTERYWIPLVRLLARERLDSSDRSASLRIAPERVRVGAPVTITLRISDALLASTLPERVEAEIVSGESVVARVPLAGEQSVDDGSASRARSTFVGQWTPARAGRYEVRLPQGALERLGLRGSIIAGLPDAELRTPQTDHALLEALAAATGGRTAGTPEEITELVRAIPNRSVMYEGTTAEATLWDRWVVLLALIALLTAEWVARRLVRLA